MKLLRGNPWILAVLLLVPLLLQGGQARADAPLTSLGGAEPGDVSAEGAPAAPTAWSEGVSLEEQAAAVRPFEEGNAFLKDALFKLAAERYHGALEHWDHPGIHFNLALALFSLDQPEEVYLHLKQALAYGEGPIDIDKLERAKSYIMLLEQQLAPVAVTCEVVGAVVRMDGQVLFTAPGKYEGWVRAGEHTWSAAKPGYELTRRTRVLKPKVQVGIKLNLYRTEELTTSRRRWSGWVPATPLIGGVLLAGGGVALTLVGRDTMARSDGALNSQCGLEDEATRRSCLPSDTGNQVRQDAELTLQLATGTFIAAGVVLATGVVLLSLNRPTTYRQTPDERDAQMKRVAVVPWFGSGSVGAVASGQF